MNEHSFSKSKYLTVFIETYCSNRHERIKIPLNIAVTEKAINSHSNDLFQYDNIIAVIIQQGASYYL